MKETELWVLKRFVSKYMHETFSPFVFRVMLTLVLWHPFQIGIDVGSSTVARGVVNLVLGYLNHLVIEMAFLIQVK